MVSLPLAPGEVGSSGLPVGSPVVGADVLVGAGGCVVPVGAGVVLVGGTGVGSAAAAGAASDPATVHTATA